MVVVAVAATVVVAVAVAAVVAAVVGLVVGLVVAVVVAGRCPVTSTQSHDEGAEKAVLGSVLLDQSCIPAVRAILSPASFYHPAHAEIFGAFCALADRGEPIDFITVCAHLRAIRRLNTVGGLQYLGELTDYTPSIANVSAHARIVADLALIRRAALAIEKAHSAINDPIYSLAEIREILQTALKEITS